MPGLSDLVPFHSGTSIKKIIAIRTLFHIGLIILKLHSV